MHPLYHSIFALGTRDTVDSHTVQPGSSRLQCMFTEKGIKTGAWSNIADIEMLAGIYLCKVARQAIERGADLRGSKIAFMHRFRQSHQGQFFQGRRHDGITTAFITRKGMAVDEQNICSSPCEVIGGR